MMPSIKATRKGRVVVMKKHPKAPGYTPYCELSVRQYGGLDALKAEIVRHTRPANVHWSLIDHCGTMIASSDE